ncbi:MAG TPA: hypothetical protein VD859_13875 [Nocardioides sp.]|nr:hypothetical protein [Nocardioides sp.]
MEINGLPLHVLAVHAAVVFGPLAALVALGYAALPSWRDRLRWVTLAVVLIAAAAAWLAYFSGKDFLDSDRFAFLADSPEIAEKVRDHEELGEVMPWVASGFAAVTLLATLLHERRGAVRVVLSVLVVVGALATLVYTFLTGEAGSQAVWGS